MAAVVSSDRRFCDLYDAHAASVLAYFRRRTDAETARDCAADTFLVAWRRIDEVPDDALPWLYGVARRVLANQRRSSGRIGRLVAKLAGTRTDTPAIPETVVVRRAEEAELMAAVHRLRPEDREVLLLATWEELSHAEIGAIVGCSAHAVDQRIHRARRRLGRELARPGQKVARSAVPTTQPGGEQR